MGWYDGKWWLRQTEGEGLDCTGQQRESILEHALTVHHFNFYVPNEMNTTSGIVSTKYYLLQSRSYSIIFVTQTGSQFKEQESIQLEGPPRYNRVQFSPYCYDAVWTLAYALNETLQGLFNLQSTILLVASLSPNNFILQNIRTVISSIATAIFTPSFSVL